MYNYSARPWIAIGVYLILLSSLFYLRKPFSNGPVDIVPLWIIAILFGFMAFFVAAYVVDYVMIFPTKFILHEVYQFRDSTSSSPYLSAPAAAPSSARMVPPALLESYDHKTSAGDEEYHDDFVSTVPASSDSSESSSLSRSSSSSSSSSSASSSLRPRRDANNFIMF